jgi:hypothetical protein
MARVTGKGHGKRRNPPRAKKVRSRSRAKVSASEGADTANLSGSVSPAVDRSLPELVRLQHIAIHHFSIGPSGPWPSKRELVEFFKAAPLSNGARISDHHANVMATFVRPLSAMVGGRPTTTGQPSGEPPTGTGATDEQADSKKG